MRIRFFKPIARPLLAAALALFGLATAAAQDEPLPPGALTRLGTLRFRHGGNLGDLAITRDGRLLASAGKDGKVRLFDRRTGRQARVLDDGATDVFFPCVAISPDGKLIASGSTKEGGVQLWDVAGGRKVRSLPAATSAHFVVFSPDGKALAGCGSARVYLWDIGTGRLMQQWQSEPFFLHSLHFSEDGRTLIAANKGGTIYFWDTTSGKESRRWPRLGALRLLALSCDGKTLAATEDGKHGVRLWDVATGRHLSDFDLEPDSSPTALAWAPDGKTLVVGDFEGRLFFCDPARGKVVHKAEAGGRVVSLLFVPGSPTVISANEWGVIRLWDSGKEIAPTPGHQGYVTSLVISPDGRTLYSAGGEGSLRFWEVATGRQVHCLNRQVWNRSRGKLALSADGKMLALAGHERGIEVLETATGKEVRHLGEMSNHALAFSPADKPLLASSAITRFSLWDARTGERVRRKSYGWITAKWIDFTPDGKTILAAILPAAEVYVIDAATLKLQRTLPTTPASSFALSGEGRRLAVARDDGFIDLWDIPSGRHLFRLEGPRGKVGSLAFSPDGATLAAGDEQGDVRLWEMATGRQRGCFKGQRGKVLCLAFAPDGHSLASAGADTTILLWDLTGLAGSKRKPPTEDELQALWQDLAGRDASRAYRAVWVLAQFPELSVPFLRRRLRPAASYSSEHLSRLIHALGSDSFAVRDDASRELEAAEGQAEPALRAALAREADLEVRRRVELLLGKLDERVRDPETLRAVRSIEALEHAGTPEARAVLEKLARGAEGARGTRQARAALERLSKRSTRKPEP